MLKASLPLLLVLAPALLTAQQKPTPDVPAAVAAILKADVDFNKAVADRSRERFLAFIHENAVFSGGTPSVGMKA